MDPFITLKSLATETWFVELLAGKGFSKSSENTFTNGKAKIRVEGTRFFADPGAEDSTFKADFRQADRKTVIFMVDQILKMHAFRTDEELMQERAEKKNVDRALAGIAHTIRGATRKYACRALAGFFCHPLSCPPPPFVCDL